MRDILRHGVEIIDLSKENFVDEVFIQDFSDTDYLERALLYRVYEQTFHRIGTIVEKRHDLEQNNKNIYYKKRTKCNNIIPLLGERGTGKTSAMLSTINFLVNTEWKNHRKKFFKLNQNNSIPKFVCIDKIDADLLRKGESIFETVLIAMYNKYEEYCDDIDPVRNRNKEYIQRELGKEFTDILKSFNYRRNFEKQIQSEIQTLHHASLRINISKDFDNLVKHFLQFLSDDNSDSNSFLVIGIDDIDLNIDDGFALMEEINQYFMSYHIIVLMTLDIMQFSHICENHFAKLCPMNSTIIEESKDYDKEQYWKKYVSQITQNYIDKILPAENRICLPGIRNENSRPYLINFEQATVKNLDKKEIKWVILYKIFRRTGIICDGLGKKKHYYEPDTLRKIVSLVDYLNQMEIVFDLNNFTSRQLSLEKLKKQQYNVVYKALKDNILSIYKDIVERMEYEKLQPERRTYFDDIRRQHSSRQCSGAYKFLIREIQKLSGKDASDEDEIFSLINRYSYGNYIQILYKYSLNYEKNMVQMFLAIHTSNLTYLYNQVLLARGQKQTEEEKKILDNFRLIIGNSITGDWSSVMLHNIVKNSDFKTEGLKDDFSSARLNLHPMLASNNIVCKMKLPEETEKTEICNVIKATIDTFSMLIPYNQEIEVSIEEGSIELKTLNPTKTMDVFGFVMRYFDFEKYQERLKKRILISEEPEKKLKEKYGISNWEDILPATEQYTDCALPIYSLDVYYNLLKRLYENKDTHFENMNYKDVNSLGEDDIGDIILGRDDINMVTEYADGYLKLLYRVKYLLNKQDEYYNDNNVKLLKLEKKFSDSPFVSRFFEKEQKNNLVTKYSFAVIGCVLLDFYKKQTVPEKKQTVPEKERLNMSSEENKIES